MKTLTIDQQNNEVEILTEALSEYLEKLQRDVARTNNGSGWPEINAEIATVNSLIERLLGARCGICGEQAGTLLADPAKQHAQGICEACWNQSI